MSDLPAVDGFFHDQTSTVTYLVADPHSGEAAIVDPVLDYDWKEASIATSSVDQVLAHAASRGFHVRYVLETHAHADHLSAAAYIRQQSGALVVTGSRIVDVQAAFKSLFDLGDEFTADGRQFDRLLADGDRLVLGRLQLTAWHVPGHTPADTAFLVGDAVFVGDTLFMPEGGTARADFPGADPRTLYRSIRRLLELPAATRMFVCHDYPRGRPAAWETTIADQRSKNIHVRDGMDEETFVKMRSNQDATLGVPALILPALQVNLRAGRLPLPAENGISYLRLPLNAAHRLRNRRDAPFGG